MCYTSCVTCMYLTSNCSLQPPFLNMTHMGHSDPLPGPSPSWGAPAGSEAAPSSSKRIGFHHSGKTASRPAIRHGMRPCLAYANRHSHCSHQWMPSIVELNIYHADLLKDNTVRGPITVRTGGSKTCALDHTFHTFPPAAFQIDPLVHRPAEGKINPMI